MWCDSCQRDVDINSVAVNEPKRGYSMDIGEGMTTTAFTSSSAQITNVCKSCGESEYLFPSKAAALAALEARDFESSEKKRLYPRKKMICFVAAVFIGLFLGDVWGGGAGNLNMGGFLIGWITGIIGAFFTLQVFFNPRPTGYSKEEWWESKWATYLIGLVMIIALFQGLFLMDTFSGSLGLGSGKVFVSGCVLGVTANCFIVKWLYGLCK